MRHLFKTNILAWMLAMGAGAMTSCTDYLDKAPESDISETAAYADFTNFQGFTEEIYNCIPDFVKGYWNNSWNWGEDELINVGTDYLLGYKIDQGDFWGWQTEHDGWNAGPLDRATANTSDDRMTKGLWPLAWYGIRKANMGLANIGLMKGTDEEKNLIMGQLYFFRGFFHFQLIQYFGGLPYINTVLPSNEKLTLPRLSYQACADSIAADLRRAADLLPINWDNTTVGLNTYGKNQLRVTKIAALGYLGKDLLWAGSPLMNKESTGSEEYNKDYCQRAAEVFGELLTLVESGKTQFGLLDFDEYSANFFTKDQSYKMPGESQDNTVTEAIFRGPSYGGPEATTYNVVKQFGGGDLTTDNITLSPTANYVNYYGMANGLPLDDPKSGFDETHPWKGRDPRFYHDIVFDGVKVVQGDLSSANEKWRYADLQTDGLLRDINKDSRTGYLNKKFVDSTCNRFDDGYAYSHFCHIHIPLMRLSDVYLMYAEATAEGYSSPTAHAKSCSLSAVDAVNKVRARAGVADVNAKFTGSTDAFMPELRRERAVELSWEGHRFNDLRRWLLLDKYPYTIKTSQEFKRVGSNNTADPKQNRVSGWSEKVILTRNFSEKHYWLPLKTSDVNIYLEFTQNPGW